MITDFLKWLQIAWNFIGILILFGFIIYVSIVILFYILDKIILQKDNCKELFKYYWVRKEFKKWVKL